MEWGGGKEGVWHEGLHCNFRYWDSDYQIEVVFFEQGGSRKVCTKGGVLRGVVR